MPEFYVRDEHVPMHYYEAMQIFAHIFGMPELHTGAEIPEGADAILVSEGNPFFLTACDAQKSAEADDPVFGKHPQLSNDRNLLKRLLYKRLTEIYNYESPWGALTGVRPTKVLTNLVRYGLTDDEIREHFRKFYYMSESKIGLCFDTYYNQKDFLGVPDSKICGFYIGIPFCPTVCSYCTFGSSPIARYAKRVPEYVDYLIKEIEFTAGLMRGRYEPESIYVGGGTPTSVDGESLEKILSAVADNFDISGLKEFCVEAGRPDTITADKLKIIKNAGVTRISINPQTMNDETLLKIGRAHTRADIIRVYNEARALGFDNINMDIIAGLPDESTGDFEFTLEELAKLKPDAVTCHTLALKRASSLSKAADTKDRILPFETEKMVDSARRTLKNAGLRPFYLYRQKNCVGNNENVSYAMPGKESPYNIHIMEEDMTIIACGAGAVTKIIGEGTIDRFFNMKSVEDYFGMYQTVLERKRKAICSE